MEQNILVLSGPTPATPAVADLAARVSDDLGLVDTRIALSDEKVSGGRIEEERDYGGQSVQAFDEPIFIGAAIAQLAGHLDVVVVDDLALWMERLFERFPGDEVEREAEIRSLASIMAARMCALVLVGGAPLPADHPGAARHAALLDQLREQCHTVVDLSSGEEQVLKGAVEGP